jgi:hypothetical protein
MWSAKPSKPRSRCLYSINLDGESTVDVMVQHELEERKNLRVVTV